VLELVRGWIQQSYVRHDGWWAQLVLDEFGFLLDRGFSLTSSEMAGVHFHQKGHYVWFDGPTRDVAVDYDPETNTIGADVVEHDGPRFIPLDGLIARFVPDARVPSRSPLDRSAIEENVRWWAAGLKEIASEVL
jgi:hypothetical protein